MGCCSIDIRTLLFCHTEVCCVTLVQALLKKHETVMADVETFAATISSLEEQSKKCTVGVCGMALLRV